MPRLKAISTPLFDVVGQPFGQITGLFTPITEEYPQPEKVMWAEAVRVSFELKNGVPWLLLDPDLWIWPPRARRIAVDFLDKRRSDRRNDKYNALLDAWVQIVLGTEARNTEIDLTAFDDGVEPENPAFRIGSRTAFARRSSS